MMIAEFARVKIVRPEGDQDKLFVGQTIWHASTRANAFATWYVKAQNKPYQIFKGRVRT